MSWNNWFRLSPHIVNFTTAGSTVEQRIVCSLSGTFEIIEVNQHKSSLLLFFLSGFCRNGSQCAMNMLQGGSIGVEPVCCCLKFLDPHKVIIFL